MSRSLGYATITGPDGRVELDTLTCGHCNTVILVHDAKTGSRVPPERLGGGCTLCDKPTCPQCTGRGCTPFERKLEAIERGRAFVDFLEGR